MDQIKELKAQAFDLLVQQDQYRAAVQKLEEAKQQVLSQLIELQKQQPEDAKIDVTSRTQP